MSENLTSNLKIFVRGSYDLQKIRIQTGNRIAMNWKAKLGQGASEKEETLDEEAQDTLKQIRKSFSKLMDGVKTFPRQKTFKGDAIISTYTEMCLVNQYIDLEKAEDAHFRKMDTLLMEFPVYVKFLKPIKGVGPAMAGVILSEIDIHKAEYPSSIWAYAGLDVADDGKGRSKRKEHLVTYNYVDKDGNDAIRNGITFNPFLKSKLIGVLAASFLRAGKEGYSLIYYDYKNRLENMEAHAEKSKGHRHNMALRYMVKLFLIDLHKFWRAEEGLKVSESYCEAKLGKVHKKA